VVISFDKWLVDLQTTSHTSLLTLIETLDILWKSTLFQLPAINLAHCFQVFS